MTGPPTARQKDLIVIGGPNGAGKSTLAGDLLPKHLGLLEFVNADNIAAGLSPFAPETAAIPAARIMLGRMRDLIAAERSFAFETTCSGLGHARTIARCRAAGWRVTLVFLYLDSPDIAVARVAGRVAMGGHAIPEDTIRRRYRAGLRNLVSIYLPQADALWIHDNSLGLGTLIAHKTLEAGFIADSWLRWEQLNRHAHEGSDIC